MFPRLSLRCSPKRQVGWRIHIYCYINGISPKTFEVQLSHEDRSALTALAADRKMSPSEWIAALAHAHIQKKPRWNALEYETMLGMASAMQQVEYLLQQDADLRNEHGVPILTGLVNNFANLVAQMNDRHLAYWGTAPQQPVTQRDKAA